MYKLHMCASTPICSYRAISHVQRHVLGTHRSLLGSLDCTTIWILSFRQEHPTSLSTSINMRWTGYRLRKAQPPPGCRSKQCADSNRSRTTWHKYQDFALPVLGILSKVLVKVFNYLAKNIAGDSLNS